MDKVISINLGNVPLEQAEAYAVAIKLLLEAANLEPVVIVESKDEPR